MAGIVKPARVRHLRRRRFKGLTRGGVVNDAATGVPRLKRLEAWLQKIAAAAPVGIGDTATARSITGADVGADELTITSHGLTNGPLLPAGGDLPAPLVNGSQYWPNVVDANTISLHTSHKDAKLDLRRVNITDAGAGIRFIGRDTNRDGFVEIMRQGFNSETVDSATDIDDL